MECWPFALFFIIISTGHVEMIIEVYILSIFNNQIVCFVW